MSALERILARLDAADETVTAKTAAAQEPSAEALLVDKVRKISEATKTASAAPASAPAAELGRMAKEAQVAEDHAMVKQAASMGAALCDGFMERFAQYDAALTQSGVKVATAAPASQVKEAAEHAYRQAVTDMEKHAADEFNRGYSDTMKHVHKLASDIHYAGQAMAHNLIESNKTK